MYDYWLGGKDHEEEDRQKAEEISASLPADPAEMARANREFLQYAVDRLVTEYGIRQFLDIGSGLPTMGNTHEIAQRLDPTIRVVYCDFDPVVVRHAQQLLTGPNVIMVQHDVRDIAGILSDPAVRDMIDFDQPVGFLMIAVLHFVVGDVTGITRAMHDAGAPGSVLALTHGTGDRAVLERMRRIYRDTNTSGQARSPEEIRALFDSGWDLEQPGLADVEHWPLVPSGRPAWIAAGIGRWRPVP